MWPKYYHIHDYECPFNRTVMKFKKKIEQVLLIPGEDHHSSKNSTTFTSSILRLCNGKYQAR